MKKKNIVLLTLILLLAKKTGGVDCFPKSSSLLPKPLVGKTAGGGPEAGTEI